MAAGRSSRLSGRDARLWTLVERQARLNAAARLASGNAVDPHAIAETVLRASTLGASVEHVDRLESYVRARIPELKLRVDELRRGGR